MLSLKRRKPTGKKQETLVRLGTGTLMHQVCQHSSASPELVVAGTEAVHVSRPLVTETFVWG